MSASPVQRVAFVEIHDDVIHVLSHLARKEEVDPAVLISSSADTSACRMADLLMIPTLGEIDPSVLQSCDLVVVGDSDPGILQSVAEAVAGTGAVIRLAEEMLPELAEEGLDPGSPAGFEVVVPEGAEEAAPRSQPTVPPRLDLILGGGGEEGDIPLPEWAVSVEPEPASEPEPAPSMDAALPPETAIEPPSIPELEPVVEEAALPSEPASPPSAPETEGVALSDLFGEDIDPGAVGFAIEDEAAELVQLLETMVRETHASTGSLMLPEPGGAHLRIVAATGLKEEAIRRTRPAVGEGVAGEAFASGRPRMVQVEVPSFAEGDELVRVAAAVPILVEDKVVGVLSVNIDADARLEEEQVFAPLARIAGEAPARIREAVDYVHLDLDTKRRLVLSRVDAILAGDTSFPARLRETGEVLRELAGADFDHLYLVDSIEHRLQLITPEDGLASTAQRIDRGFLAWVVDDGRPRVLWVDDEKADLSRGLAFLPVATHRPYGLLHLENLRAPRDQKEGVEALLAEVVAQIGETLEVEQGVGSQDVLSELNMRIADRAGQIDLLPVDLRTAPWLEFGIRILAAEAAIWIPEPGGHPTVAQPQTRQAATLLAQAWDRLEELASRTRELGVVAAGARGPGWEPEGPSAPAPWIGVRSPEGEGVLIAFFRGGEGEEGSGPPDQIPVRILSDVLGRIAERIEHPAAVEADPLPASGNGTESSHPAVPLLNREEFLAALHRNWEEALASRTSLSVTRVRPVGAVPGNDVEHLRGFLRRQGRAGDTVAEVATGVFLILTSGPHLDESGLRTRIERGWEELHPEFDLHVESIGAGDVEGESALQAWLLEDGERKAA